MFPRGRLTSAEPVAERWSESVELPVRSTVVALSSGRRFELESEQDCDRLTVRTGTGQLVLDMRVTDAGPVLRITGAEIELEATRKLRLGAEQIDVHATRGMMLEVDGDLEERVHGDHHRQVDGEQRLEAASVAVQSNERSVCLRAMGRVALDGEHIGLNDEPALEPFDWSAIAPTPQRR